MRSTVNAATAPAIQMSALLLPWDMDAHGWEGGFGE